MRKHIITVLLSIGLFGFIALAVTNIQRTNTKLKFEQIEVKSNEAKLIELNIKYDQLLKQKTNTDSEKQDQLNKIQELENERKRLEGELQAKRNKESSDRQKLAVAAQKASGTAVASASGGCADWMAQAGISHPDAIWLISKESGCRSNAVNPSSYACGIAQELLEPNQRARQIASVKAGVCPKSGCSMSDPVCQMKWMQNYTYGRYGSWSAARAFHIRNNWY